MALLHTSIQYCKCSPSLNLQACTSPSAGCSSLKHEAHLPLKSFPPRPSHLRYQLCAPEHVMKGVGRGPPPSGLVALIQNCQSLHELPPPLWGNLEARPSEEGFCTAG
eukprot:763976-Hanusia_phi.AAC.4